MGPPEKPEEPPAGEYVMISVTDTGCGFAKDVLAKAFEPFFTTKEIGKGSGLGLSQVLGFAKQSGGGMRIETRVGEGTSVKVYLPRAAESDVLEVSSASVGFAQPPRKGAIILLIDDDSAVREVTSSMLRELGYVVMEVGSVDLVILDFAMPGMNGVDVARELSSKYPTLPVVFVTGYADDSLLEAIGDARIIKKPFVGDELVTKVQAALTKSEHRSGGKVVPLARQSL